MQEKENILRILEETEDAIKSDNTFKIKQLSDQTNNTASKTQDADNIAVAVIVYSIGKILEKNHYRKFREWKSIYEMILRKVKELIVALRKNNRADISEKIISLRKELENISGDLKPYIRDVFRKASINKASKIYEHGVSMEKTAELLGITLFELASYAGQKTGIDDIIEKEKSDTRTRIKLAMELFDE